MKTSAYTFALALLLATPAFAAPSADSAYSTDPQSSHVEDQTSQGIGEVNMIVCIMSAMRADALVNEGNYIALVDKNKCEASKSGASGAGSEGATASASYVTSVVNSSRVSNDEPMIVKTWLDLSEEEMRETVFVHIAASEAPSASNPYGVFRLDFCGQPEGSTGCAMNGYLEGADSGLNFFEAENFGGQSRTVAMRLDTTGSTSGSGKMDMQGDEGSGGFTFAYDQNLFRRSDGSDEQCFSRDASDPDTGMSVWRYGLYDAATGARIERNSGFPIEFTHEGDTFHGFLGYYGLSLPPEAANALENGDTVEKVDYSTGNDPTRTAYTVLRAGGKLIKYTRHTRTLAQMDQIAFNTFVADDADNFFVGATPFTQYVLHWDEDSGTFKVTAQMDCSGGNGCQNQQLPSEQTVLPSYWASRGGAQGWSESLGGEIFINLQGAGNTVDSAAVQVVYRSQDLVYPSELPAQLYCVRECPTAATMGAYFAAGSQAQSPFVMASFNNWNPTPAQNVMHYTTSVDTALLIDNNGDDVVFTDAAALDQRPQYRWGVRSGRLFTSLADAECAADSGTYCDWKVNELEEYYQWETGPNNWNQFAAVKDGSGNFVNFDPPLQVSFQVPDGAAYGSYAGQSILLQYGGFGDLWGIPGHCVSRSTNEPVANCDESSRYVPAFVIPFDQDRGRVTLDGSTYLVKWLDREIRFAKKDLSACTGAGLELPDNVTLPTAASLKDPSDPASDIYIGSMPTVTDAARVIHGEVKF